MLANLALLYSDFRLADLANAVIQNNITIFAAPIKKHHLSQIMRRPVRKTYALKQVGDRTKRVIDRLYIGGRMICADWNNTVIVNKIFETVKTAKEFDQFEKHIEEYVGALRCSLIKSEFVRLCRKEERATRAKAKLAGQTPNENN